MVDVEYAFPVEKWARQVEKEVTFLKGNWRNQMLPSPVPRAYGNNKKDGTPNECYKYCAWRDTCFKMENIPIPADKGE